MSLFHYTSLDTFLNYIIPDKSLLSNSLGNMNDPRESSEWAFGSVNLPLEDIFAGYYSDKTHIDCQFKFGKMVKDRFQVICFSGAQKNGWDNEMMWAHYGDKHKGICLEFNEEELLQNIKSAFPDSRFQLREVNYERKRREKPWIHWDGRLSKDDNLTNFLEVLSRDVIFSKSQFWELEDEKRLVFLNQNERLLIPFKNALKAVHIGLGIPKLSHEGIYEVLVGTGIKLYVMIYDDDIYKRWCLTKKEQRWWTSTE